MVTIQAALLSLMDNFFRRLLFACFDAIGINGKNGLSINSPNPQKL